jgi:hypothetical protein
MVAEMMADMGPESESRYLTTDLLLYQKSKCKKQNDIAKSKYIKRSLNHPFGFAPLDRLGTKAGGKTVQGAKNLQNPVVSTIDFRGV